MGQSGVQILAWHVSVQSVLVPVYESIFDDKNCPGEKDGRACFAHLVKMQVTGNRFPRKGSYTTSEHGERGLPEELFPDMFPGNTGFPWPYVPWAGTLTPVLKPASQCLAQCHVPSPPVT